MIEGAAMDSVRYDGPWIPPVRYPESDGRPMGETDQHWDLTVALVQALRAHFEDRPDVYVASNNFIYYVEGEPARCVSPDVYVVFGVEKRQRPIYKVWEEGKGPDVVFELTSKNTKADDLGSKKGIYEFLGVSEYFLIDPLSEYLRPPEMGWRLGEHGYIPIVGDLHSQRLGLSVRRIDGVARLVDATTGRVLPTAEEDRKRVREADQELARLKAELERRG